MKLIKEVKTMTNFERIKQMSAKEIADLIDNISFICVDKNETNSCKHCPIYECTKIEGCDFDVIMGWLESEVKDNG